MQNCGNWVAGRAINIVNALVIYLWIFTMLAKKLFNVEESCMVLVFFFIRPFVMFYYKMLYHLKIGFWLAQCQV